MPTILEIIINMNFLSCMDPECPLMKTVALVPYIAIGVIVLMVLYVIIFKPDWD